MKLWLFAARIAAEPFPQQSHRYLFEAKRLVPPRPIFWSFADVREEVDWCVENTRRRMVG
jgi:hypothetical protein